MLSSQNVAIAKILFRSKVMPFLIIVWVLFFLMGKESFDQQQWYWGPNDATPQADDLW